MKVFDKVIMNPPYSNNYLHIQIATTASCHANEGVLLCPSSWIMRPLKLEDSLELKKHISKIEDVSNIFDAELGGGMSLFIIDNKKEYSLYKDIPFKNFKYPFIAKEAFRIIYEEKRYPLLWDKCLKDTKKVNKDSWYVGVPRIRGHLDPVTLEPKWDYYTLCASDNRPLKGEIYNKWAYTFEFSNEEEALAFRNYLDSDIVGYLLRLIKRGHGDRNLIKNMPYPLTLEDLADEVSKTLGGDPKKILKNMQEDLV